MYSSYKKCDLPIYQHNLSSVTYHPYFFIFFEYDYISIRISDLGMSSIISGHEGYTWLESNLMLLGRKFGIFDT